MAIASGLAVAQHPLQRLQLEHAVDVELGLGEVIAALGGASASSRSTVSFLRGALITQVPASRSPTRIRSLLKKGKKRKIAGPGEAGQARSRPPAVPSAAS